MTIQDILYQNKKYIIESYQNGKSTLSLAIEYHCNPGTIWYFLKDNNIEIHNKMKVDRLKNHYEEVVKLFNEGLSCGEIGRRLNFSRAATQKYMKGIGLDTSRYNDIDKDNLLKDKTQEVLKMYGSGLSTTKIAKQLGHSEASIWHLLQDNEIKCRDRKKYTVNDSFFDVINSKNKAWCLGFCYSDGNVNTKNNTVRFFQNETDAYILEDIKREMEYTGPIYREKDTKNPQHKKIYTLQIKSDRLVKSLFDKGCMPAKSLILDFPSFNQVPENLMSSFLLGVFDGDGSIQKITHGTYAPCSITSNDQFCESLGIFLYCKLDISGQFYYRYKDKPDSVCGTLMFTKKDACKKFLDYIYQDIDENSIYLKRKYERYKDMFYRRF